MNNSLKAIEIRMLAQLRQDNSWEIKGYRFDYEKLRKFYRKRFESERLF
jgi:hypothetical protein